jgi:photosystem II stability/assembly factor-like uncharacterized protein
MKNSMRISVISLSILFLPFSFFGQKENKYQKKNNEAPSIQYTTDKCYSRSVQIRDSILYTGNSNGALYAYSLRDSSSKNLMINKKFEEMRDIEFCGDHLFGMQSGSYGVLAKTDGTQFIDFILGSNKVWHGVFLDGIAFYDSIGFAMGDPKNGFFTLAYSTDCGNTWNACEGKVENQVDEGGFAASGTNVQVLDENTFIFVSGGKKSRFFRSNDRGKTWVNTSLPYLTSTTSGAFSVLMLDSKNGVIVGGDYANPDMNLNVAYITDDGGKFWMNSTKQPRGYRSCVIEANGVLYTCGTTGIDVSFDKGNEWTAFADGNFFAMCADQDHLYATMKDGQVKVMELARK